MHLIDAHQHFWRLDRGDYGWLTPEAGALYRDWRPADLEPLLAAHGVRATVLVQAAPTEAETDYLLRLAHDHAFIAGVVGWSDFEAADAPRRIAALAARGEGRLRGLRPMVQDIADPGWLARPDLDPAFAAMAGHGLVFDALVRPRHLAPLHARLLRHPDLRAVIDHAGKPDIAGGGFDGWAQDIAALARDTGAYCKLSGLPSEAGEGADAGTLDRYVTHVLACFGPERVLWGSDWPVLNLCGDYGGWLALARDLVRRHAPEAEARIFGGNAAILYGLEFVS
ncbi:amidohydrolase family protein [Luteimonas salinilitoris]|uniref:Amidohydrolase n=1 Tax=Luteimonas salinilitoris TaxID=3237697 RepID=A0ABV4HSS7_9GAMM